MNKIFPVLHTNRLILRQVTFNDENDILYLRSNEQIMLYIKKPKLESLEDANRFINEINNTFEKGDGIIWGIELRNDNYMEISKLIGTISIEKIQKEHFRGEIGYLLHPNYQRKGLMEEALAIVLNYAFTQMKLHSIEANVDPNNQASIKLLEKTHFQKEGYLKQNWCYLGLFSDTIVYSIINPYDS